MYGHDVGGFQVAVRDGLMGAKLETIDPQPQFQPARITVADMGKSDARSVDHDRQIVRSRCLPVC
jgi:hypothetical protein